MDNTNIVSTCMYHRGTGKYLLNKKLSLIENIERYMGKVIRNNSRERL